VHPKKIKFPNSKEMKVAVIGGTGLMGPYLTAELVKGGHTVTCLNRRGTSSIASAIKTDRRDKTSLKSAFKSIDPYIVIDMIPYTVEDAETLSDILETSPDTQLIAISSIDVYQAYGRIHRTELGPYQDCPIKEEDELRKTLSFQGPEYDKLGVENIYRNSIKNLSILRMPAIYGWPDTSRIQEYLDCIEKKEGTFRIHPKFAKWGYTRASAIDCAHAIFLTLGQKGHNTYNVGEEKLYSEEEWCQIVWNAAGTKGNIVYDKTAPIPFNADIKQKWHVDTSKIRRELGYTETTNPLEEIRNIIQKKKTVPIE
tara:strand:- start:365 stop:1300 length:936 start_codon:yes stop_codon:yes gene_type:complete